MLREISHKYHKTITNISRTLLQRLRVAAERGGDAPRGTVTHRGSCNLRVQPHKHTLPTETISSAHADTRGHRTHYTRRAYMLSHGHASSTQLAVPTSPCATSARRASGGRNDGVAKGTSPSFSGIRCVSGTVFLVAAIPATTLPAPCGSTEIGQYHSRGRPSGWERRIASRCKGGARCMRCNEGESVSQSSAQMSQKR
jgi:hypothetical protein